MAESNIQKTMKIFYEIENSTKRWHKCVEFLQSLEVHPIIKNQIDSKMERLKIRLCGDPQATAKELFKKMGMYGECWQVSNFLSPFFKDEDFVVRGVINGDYEHGWIEFKSFKTLYVFDPALSILCKKDDYYSAFKPKADARVNVEDVKQKLIEMWNDKSLRKIPYGKTIEYVFMCGSNDPSDPIYRGSYDFRLNLKGKKIDSIQLHTYMNG